MELGASLGVPAMTAHRCLFADGPVTGKTVLVAGGAGAVGHFAIELARRSGARVIATASGPEKAELARQAGAEHVVNYRDADAAGQISAVAPRVDRVIEVALGANLALDLAVAGPGTMIVTYAAEATDPVLPVRACMTANVMLRFILLYGVPRRRARPGGGRHHHRAYRGSADRAAGAPLPALRHRRRPRGRGGGPGREGAGHPVLTGTGGMA